MKPVFADIVYYLALINRRDQYAAAATEFTAGFSGAFVTPAWVLTEVANALTRGSDRALFVELYRELADDRRVTIEPGRRQQLHTSQSRNAGPVNCIRSFGMAIRL